MTLIQALRAAPRLTKSIFWDAGDNRKFSKFDSLVWVYTNWLSVPETRERFAWWNEL